jgi:hypothetical protein
MSVKEQYWKYSLITIILGLGLILFIKMSPFMGGILGACTIYIMVRKQMFYLTEGGNLAASKIRNLECPNYEICLIDYGCGKFNRKIHIMEQYP